MLTAAQQSVDVLRLRRSSPVGGVRRQRVAFQHDDLIEMIGKGTCCRQTADTGTENDRPLADKIRCHPCLHWLLCARCGAPSIFRLGRQPNIERGKPRVNPVAITDKPLANTSR